MYSVNLVIKHPDLMHKIKHTVVDYPLFDCVFTARPRFQEPFDAFVLPSTCCGMIDRTVAEPLVISYGSLDEIGSAFVLGCQDFLREPWEPIELFARLLKHTKTTSFVLDGKPIVVAPDSLRCNLRTVHLTAQEHAVLNLLLRKRGEVVSKSALEQLLWDETRPESRCLDMHISLLRKKIRAVSDAGGNPIQAVRGSGYRLSCG